MFGGSINWEIDMREITESYVCDNCGKLERYVVKEGSPVFPEGWYILIRGGLSMSDLGYKRHYCCRICLKQHIING